MAKLLIVKGSGRGTAFDLGDTVTIGRGASSTIQLADDQVSREHARIERKDDEYVIQDLGSSNGLILNGLQIQESVLEPGDEIEIGNATLVFEPSYELKRAGNTDRRILLFSDAEVGLTSVVRSTVSADEPPGSALEEEAGAEKLESATRHLRALYAVGLSLATVEDLPQLLEEVLNVALEAIQQGEGAILLRHEGTGDLTPAAVRASGSTAEDISMSRTIIERAISKKEAILTADAQRDPRFEQSQSIALHDMRSVMCVPLISRGDVLGVMHIESSEGASAFQEEDLRLLVAIAGPAAVAIDNARQYFTLQEENKELRRRVKDDLQIIGKSTPLLKALDIAEKAAATDVTVLLTGETGTGKELFASFIHENSPRATKPFVCINCTTVSESLLESELFGHEKGAFTGAHKRKEGLFETADEGTIFLDEIGDISPSVQMKLLRAVETKTFHRVGGTDPISVDVRVIAATSRDLDDAVGKGGFREDLFYRLSVITVHLPALRERTSDIPVLVEHFLAKFREKIGKNVRRISPEARKALNTYGWPGNIRELQNVIERGVVLCDGPDITVESLPTNVAAPSDTFSLEHLAASEEPLSEKLLKLERICIERALKECKGKKVNAAKALGISRPTLDKRINQFGIEL